MDAEPWVPLPPDEPGWPWQPYNEDEDEREDAGDE